MRSSIAAALLLSAACTTAQQAIAATDLVGTWNSKANSTTTGSKFYDPVNEKFTEPAHTGISYSFSADGHFEEAYYRSVANPQKPKCPKGIIQWQHGSFQKFDNGSLVLTPIAIDGRQLYSDPCMYKNSVFTRYNTTEMFQRYEVVTDGYHKIARLNLYKFDGSPMMPLYLGMSPPDMLPTTTLNPMTTSTAGGAKSTGKIKRSEIPLNYKVVGKRDLHQERLDRWWWFGVFLTASGGILYYFF